MSDADEKLKLRSEIADLREALDGCFAMAEAWAEYCHAKVSTHKEILDKARALLRRPDANRKES